LIATNLPALLTGSSIDTGLILDNGKIIESATAAEISLNSGSTFITGTLDTSGDMGGEINVFGQDIDLVGASLNASGVNGGGEILVGGDYLGSGDRPRALTTFIDTNSVLNANAINTGNGGRIIVWSDERTDFDGSLYAKGGENIGNGGFAEISSKNILDIPAGWSQRINVGAVNGLVGKLLFDPNDITIIDVGVVPGTITNPETAIDSGNVLLDADVIAFLFGNDLQITTASGVGGSGDITVASGVDISNFANTFTLTADNNIVVDATANISPSPGGGRLVFNATNNINYQANISPFTPGAIDVDFQAGGTISTANIFTDGGSVNLQAGGNISTGDITTVGGAVTFSSTTSGIAAGAIDTSSGGGGGSVNLTGISDIVIDSIDARGILTPAAVGGGVDIVTNGLLRVTNAVGANSIDTSSLGAASGDLNITHGGGLTSTPFVVGNSSTNGTAAALTTGSETIPSVSSFPGNYIQGISPGRITISTTVPTTTTSTTTTTNPSTDSSANPDGADVDTRCPPNCDYAEDSGDPSDSLGEEGGTTNLAQIQAKLKEIFEQTKVNPALVYAFFVPADSESPNVDGSFLKENKLKTKADKANAQWEFRGDRLSDFLNAENRFFSLDEELNDDDVLELVMVTGQGKVIRYRIPTATRRTVMEEARKFVRGVTNVRSGTSNTYLSPAQYLYDVFVRPLEADIEKENIENISFVMDDGLRALPIAALHDGEKFMVEKYSIGLMPSFSLTNVSDYVEPRNNLLLAMGASEFPDQTDLPAAPLEARLIAEQIWPSGTGEALTNQRFTVAELLAARSRKPYGIVHLATHGEFRSSTQGKAYIQFKNERVDIDDFQRLQLGAPPIELLVLSACRTAFGDRNAELGFAGLALASGAKSVIGSIWYVDDAATMGLMTELYEALQSSPIKAEALQQAQLALLNGEVRQEGTQLITKNEPISLPPEYARLNITDLSHPYYWSGFTIIGNPW
jgi:CHAT domain-containing protein